MSEEDNFNESLGKLKEFTKTITPLSFQTKPQYVIAIEKELEKPTLKKDEYIKVPFNLVTDSLSSTTLYYFLAVDGILEKLSAKYINIDIEAPIIHSSLNIIGVRVIRVIELKWGTEESEELDIIYLTKPYVYILKADLNSNIDNNDILSRAFFELLGGIENKFKPLMYFSAEDGKDGIFMFFRPKDTGITQDEVAISLANVPWAVDTVIVNNYPITIYYKRKNDIAWIFVPASVIIDYVDYSFSKRFIKRNL